MKKIMFESAVMPQPNNVKKNQRNLVLLIAAACLLAIATFLAVYVLFLRDTDMAKIVTENSAVASASEAFIYFSKLTGLGVREEGEINPRTIAVMIDNNPDAYPLYGLNDAAVVYEAPVEGGITRFMAIYSASSTVEQVGPVRSARPYYLDWASEYGDALYMHCGGSADGLKEIKAMNIFDANEFYRGPYFWRDRARIAPYNLFTSSERWQKYLVDYGFGRAAKDWVGWKFGDATTSTESVTEFNLEYIKRFTVGWQFSVSSTRYERLLNNELFFDNKNQPITADNIIVQFASVSVIDEVGRRKIITVGSGEARVFRDGQMVRATWKKESENSRTIFLDESGAEILLAVGRTWVMIASLGTTLTISN